MRFLFTVWPLTGHINPNLPIAQELQRRGDEVAFYTGSQAKAAVEKAGFGFFPLRKVDEALVERVVLSQEGILGQESKAGLRRMWREWTVGTLRGQVEDLTEILATWSPDAIVCDPVMWAPFLILRETKKIPVAVFSLIPACHVSGRDAPILGIPLPRPRNGFERLRANVLRWGSDLVLGGVRKEASAVRESYGLSPLQCSVTDFAAQQGVYLVPSSPEYDYERDDRARRYITLARVCGKDRIPRRCRIGFCVCRKINPGSTPARARYTWSRGCCARRPRGWQTSLCK